MQRHIIGVILLLAIMQSATVVSSQTVVVTDQASDTTGDASAVLHLKSETKGFLPPRMTGEQREAIVTPAEGLLVYQTDGTEGIYYFKDGAWALLSTSTSDSSAAPVIKTESDTLDKTETVVFARNNINITLPAITTADNGLAITIKNIGTYTDLVTVMPGNGAQIDSGTSAPLPRWFATTMVAHEGNWYYKQRTMFPVNTMQVSWHSPWQTIDQALAFLNMHMWGPTVIKLESGTFTVSETQFVNLPYPLTIEGSSYGTTTIAAASGLANSPMFSCETECYFKMLMFDGSTLANYGNNTNEDAIHLTGSEEYYEIKDCNIDNFNKAIAIQDNVELWLFDVDIINAIGTGVEVAAGSASGVFFKVSEVDFLSCNRGIDLLSGTNARVSIINCGFYNGDSTDIGINYTPATFTTIDAVAIIGNTWNHIGEFMDGFDFSRSDGRDKEIEITGNIGEESRNPHCEIGVLNNTSTVSISPTWVKANWNSSNQTTNTGKFTVSGNRITYQPSNARDFIMWISGNIITVNGSNRPINFCVVRNGNSNIRYGETSVKTTSAGQPFQWSTVAYVPSVQPGDYFEVWTSLGASGQEDVIVQDLNWVAGSQ